jgi:hypothetical protein
MSEKVRLGQNVSVKRERARYWGPASFSRINVDSTVRLRIS